VSHRPSIQLACLAVVLATARINAQTQLQHRIVISLADRRLVLLQGDHVLKAYEIAVGKPSTPTPEGRFQVINRIPHPIWCAGGRAVRPGKANPLGTRWIGLSKKGYGIHGTNEPDSIGKAVSHGCIRMRNRDVEELFELVETGVPVELIGS
jgi:lipoprotein-anchoring transpeptidase ErfK/SrfK